MLYIPVQVAYLLNAEATPIDVGKNQQFQSLCPREEGRRFAAAPSTWILDRRCDQL
jgi:hypothetical protein